MENIKSGFAPSKISLRVVNDNVYPRNIVESGVKYHTPFQKTKYICFQLER
jgi:hypothetical protein